MKSVTMLGDRKVELVEQSDPKARGEFVVIKIHVAPMCTEYKAYRDGHKWDVIGHEAAGEVVEVAQPGKCKPGDRVVVMPQYPCGKCALCLAGDYIHCQNLLDVEKETGNIAGIATYAQYMLKQDWLSLPIPDDITYEHGSMACCGLGPTFGAMQIMQVDAFDTVLIAGMGPVGLGGVINATYRGAHVIAVESHPFRREFAKELGAMTVLNPNDGDALEVIMDLTKGVGVDKAVDCSGAMEAQRLLIDATRRKGQVTFVGEAGALEIKISQDMIRKGLSLHGAWHWNLRGTPQIMQVIRESRPKLEKLITHRFPMSKVQDAWELQITGNCGKVILKPWDNEV